MFSDEQDEFVVAKDENCKIKSMLDQGPLINDLNSVVSVKTQQDNEGNFTIKATSIYKKKIGFLFFTFQMPVLKKAKIALQTYS